MLCSERQINFTHQRKETINKTCFKDIVKYNLSYRLSDIKVIKLNNFEKYIQYLKYIQFD